MNPKKFEEILDEHFEWFMGSSQMITTPSRFKLKNHEQRDSDPPKKGYPVVLAAKCEERNCSWCSENCTREKVYKRDPGSNIWNAKCSDCKIKIKIHTSQIGQKEPEFVRQVKQVE
jgi:hypothetical protein